MNIKRSRRDRWVQGVCGGLAHAFGWNSNLVRLATVILAVIIPGFSAIPVFLLYLALGVFLPQSEAY